MSNVQEALKAYQEKKKKDKVTEALSAYENRAKQEAQNTIGNLSSTLRKEYGSLEKASKSLGWGEESYKSTVESTRDSRSNISKLAFDLMTYKGKGYYDDDEIDKALEMVTSYRTAYDGILESAKARSEYKSEDDYKSAMEKAKQYEEDLKKKLDYNLESGQKDIDYFTNELNAIDSVTRQITSLQQENEVLKLAKAKGSKDAIEKMAENERKIATLTTSLDEAYTKYGSRDELSSYISQKKAYHTLAGRAQKAVELASVSENEDFQANSQYISTEFKPENFLDKFHTTEYDLGYDDLTHQYINGDEKFRAEVRRKYDNYSRDNIYSDGESRFEEAGYDYMDENDIAIYNYYYNTEGKEKAEEFLNSIQETLNSRKAQAMFEPIEDNTFKELLFGIEAGLDQFKTGAENLFSNADYIPTSATQLASGMVREDLADNGAKLPEWLGGASIGQVAYDAINTTSNMLPSMLVSTVNPVAGVAVLGASAAGHGKAEMLNLGYSKAQATTYGLMVGASEAGLQYLLGGITKLGGVAPQGLSKLALSKVDNAFARAAITLGFNMAGEFTEESLQTVIEPWLKSLVTGVDFESPDIDEVLYSGLLGAISSLFLEGGTTIAGEVNVRNQGANLKATGSENVTKLAELGKSFAEGTSANRLGNKVDENSSAYTIGRLLTEVGGSLSETNMADIASELQAKGMSPEASKSTAKWLYKAVEGGHFNKRQQNEYLSDNRIADVHRDLFTNEENSVNKRNAEYDALYAFAQETTKAKPKTEDVKVETPTETPTKVETPSVVSNEEIKKKIEAVEGSFKVSETGKTMLGDTEVVIKEVADTKNGKTVVRLDDGTTVNASDIDFASNEEGLLYEGVADKSVETANEMINLFKSTKSAPLAKPLSVNGFMLGFNEAYEYGLRGIPFEALERDGHFTNHLVGNNAKIAYNRGVLDAMSKTAAEQSMREKTDSKKGSITFDKGSTVGIDKDGIRGESLKLLKFFNDNFSRAKIHFYASYIDRQGRRIYKDRDGKVKLAPNGKYLPDGTLAIDLNAGSQGQGLILDTVSHELTHRAKDTSPEKWKAYADFLFKHYSKGHSVEELIQYEIDFAKKKGRKLTREQAYDEAVARASERMLVDVLNGTAQKKIEELNAEHKDIVAKIKEILAKLVAKIKSLYDEIPPESKSAQIVHEMQDVAEQLQTMWLDMIVDAGTSQKKTSSETYSKVRNALGKDSHIEVNEDGEFTVGKSSDGKLLYNERTYDEGCRETLKATLEAEGFSAEDIKAALTIIDAKHDLVKRLGKEFSQQGIVNEATIITDVKNGHSALSALVKNGDYPVNIDLLTICKKRQAYQKVITRLCETGLIEQATLDSLAIAEINKILGKYGYETACLGCFVESKRLRIQEYAETICKEWNTLVDKKVGKGKAKNFDFAKDSFVEDLTEAEIVKLTGEYEKAITKEGNVNVGVGSYVKKFERLMDSVPSLQKHLTIADIATPQGVSNLKSVSPELFALVASRYGSGSPKPVQDFNPYNSELAKYGSKPKAYSSLREYLYAIGGARMQSFSDFIVENWFDYCQIVADLTARKLPMHTYTKEISLAKLFGMTGIKINMSLIPDIDRSLGKEYAGLTKNAKGEYELIFADKDRYKATGGKTYMQSINFADAIELQNDTRYSSNVGTIAIGISDKHIEMMLDDSRIRMIIPYHSSAINPIFADLAGIDYYKDYTDMQSTAIKEIYDSNGKIVDLKLSKEEKAKWTAGFEFNEVLQRLGDARATAQAYLEWCADASKHPMTINGKTYTAVLTPKFEQFAYHNNYYKLLEDFNTYDCITEQAAPQGDVQQIYPDNFEDVLRDELKHQENYRKKQDPKWESAMSEIEDYLKKHTKAETVAYADERGIKLSKKERGGIPKAKKPKEMLSDRDYSYDALTSKPNMKLTTINDVVRYKNPTSSMRDTAVKTALKNAQAIGKISNTGLTVYVNDIDTDVVLSKKSLAHGLDRRFSENLPATLKAGEILKNAIRINELTPKVKTANAAYVLIGAAKSQNGDLSIVEFVVNEYTNEVDSIEVLKSLNTKKEAAVLNAPPFTNNSLRITTSDISISYLLDIVNRRFPDILPESVLRHYGYDARPEGVLGESALFSDRDSDYLDAVNRGDMETAQRMVDEAAKEAGYTVKAYHGTKSKFNEFEKGKSNGWLGKGIYFTNNKTYAKQNGKHVISAYLDVSKMYSSEETHHFGVFAELKDKFPNIDETNITEVLSDNGYNALSYNDWDKGKIISVFSPNQIKSADPVTYDDNGNVIPLSQRFNVENDDIRYSDRDPDSFSNRSLLANALESVAQNDIERNKLKQYKDKISLIEAEQAKLAEVNGKIKELSFAKGTRDTEGIRKLQFEAKQIANRINTYDRQLLTLEATTALKGVLDREKAMAYKKAEQKGKEALAKARENATKTQRELLTRYQESRKKGVEGRKKTEMRYKIKNVVNDLNNYLLKGTKEKHVPIGLQKVVAEALDAVNMDTVGAEERIAKKFEELRNAKSPEQMAEISKTIYRLQEMGGNIKDKLSHLKTAYDDIINSEDPLVANSHDEVISNSIAKVIEDVGETPLRDMSLYQLEAVYDMYKMILTSVRNANKAFKAAKNEEISTLANRIIEDLVKQKKLTPYSKAAIETINNFNWNNLKPIYAFERIGSNTFTNIYNNVRAGEDTWARDMVEAQAFFEEQKKKHNYKSFDLNKTFDFVSSTGHKFTLRLEQIMSLYAYSKRGDQAKDHLKNGGFVFDKLTEVKEKKGKVVTVTYNLADSTAYKISDELLAEIIGTLEQVEGAKAFVDEMQEYLSSVMGEKGNEVSLAMYDVKLFKEKNYFPLKVSQDFLARAREQANGDVKLKNSGFTKSTTPKASNPIVLSSFMDVWAAHVNEMSMYHAFTLPLEDFYRVFNYSTPSVEGLDTISVVSALSGAHRDGAVQYIDQLLKDINGGARSDPRESTAKKLMANFKKASVMFSLSVVIQQPSAIVRATSLVNARYFVGKKVSKGSIKAKWEEVKKYAPVAIIKDMGHFDVGLGKGSADWLKGNKTWKDRVDDVASFAPAMADQLTWISIWNAVKRETLHTHKNLKPNSEEFLQAVGERFTEVIAKTQVYDSTLSRSGNMRSKSVYMNMLTSFLAEPTTSINMLGDALRKGKKGNVKYMFKAMGAVYDSVLLNSALVSLVYAMRDDDEDETYLEKYLSRFTSEMVDGVNPLTYIPFVKDIWSAAQGFDIERADMTLISSVLDSMQQLIKVASKDTTEMDEEELAEHRKAINEGILSITDNLASLVGLPVKNVRRDFDGIVNAIRTISKDATERDTTWGSLGDAVGEEVKNTIPVWGWLPDEKKEDKLYDAIVKSDDAYVSRIKDSYESEKSYTSAIRKALKRNDPRIKEAATAVVNGDFGKYEDIIATIVDEGHFTKKDVKSVIDSEVNDMTEDEDTTETTSNKEVSIYETEYVFREALNGDTVMAQAMREDIIRTKMANGSDRDEAEDSFNSSFTSYLKKQYDEGNVTDYEAEQMLVGFVGKDAKEAASKVQWWNFKQQYPDYDDLSESAVSKYYELAKPSGISVDSYHYFYKEKAKCEGVDKNGDGRADSGTVKAQVVALINSMSLTYAQKQVLLKVARY